MVSATNGNPRKPDLKALKLQNLSAKPEPLRYVVRKTNVPS
jgi:hypothetical protein